MPTVSGGFQPDTRSPSARRADFDLLRRIAALEKANGGGGGGGEVPAARRVDTTAPLTGGGDLSADRTLAISTFTTALKGAVPPPGTVAGKVLSDAGTWIVPAVAAPSEVAISASDPISTDPSTELWYDTDAVPPNMIPAWIPATLNSPWVNYMTNAVYRKVGDIVYLRGSPASSGGAGVIFNLPAGYLPSTQLIFGVDATNAHGRVDVFSDGRVYFQLGTPGGWVSLNNIQFSVTA